MKAGQNRVAIQINKQTVDQNLGMCGDLFPLTEETVAKTKIVENQNNGNFLQVLCSEKLLASGNDFSL